VPPVTVTLPLMVKMPPVVQVAVPETSTSPITLAVMAQVLMPLPEKVRL